MYRRRIVSLVFRRRADRSGSLAGLVLAAAGCSLAVALAGCGGDSEASDARSGARPAPADAAASYTLLQMNLCLSGFGGCNGRATYPAVVDEAGARVRPGRPGAGTPRGTLPGRVERDAPRAGGPPRLSRRTYPRRGAPL